MNAELGEKIYYSISEVASMTNLEPYVLRFWEKEFTQLKPKKNRSGNRIYQAKDIELIKAIKQLLYTDGYTIEGARKALREGKKEQEEEKPTREDLIKLLLEVKRDLEELVKLFP
ncbi:MAG: MerR family transcriptional regulator [candidate division Zixibacteria bacterium]|nr:MerR family transcriptional regulator [candidate division Zixibacteria bacterium]